MTKKIKAHPLFANWRADEVAECLNVPNEVYHFLWDTIVPMQPKPRPEREEPTREYPLRNFWSQVPHAMRRELNQAADAHEKEYNGVTNGSK